MNTLALGINRTPVWHCPPAVPCLRVLPETAARDLEGQVHIPPARCACGALEARYYMEKVAMLPRGVCPAKRLCREGARRSAVTVKLVCLPRLVAC